MSVQTEIKTLTFYSNYFNHHQRALCDEFYLLLSDGFRFVETMPMENFRSDMGWGGDAPPYVIKTYEGREEEKMAMALALSSDVVIMGTAPEIYCEERLKAGKLTFRYSERPLKEGFIKFFIPPLTKKYIRMHIKNKNKNIYVLAASAFTASDFRKMFNSYPGKCYKFGYFPKHKEYDIDKLIEQKHEMSDCVNILWLGRMIRLKRPDLLIYAAKKLRDKGYKFTVHMVGEGKMKNKLERMVKSFGLEGIVSFENFLSPDEARDRMAEYKVFVMTSNKLEGWGSVIYEGLNAGCAVVCSHICGATPWLVENGKCGLVFKSGSVASLTGKLKMLLDNPRLIDEYGKAAYKKMHDTWNPKCAAESVLRLSQGLIESGADGLKIKEPSEQYVCCEGPCSKAGYLKNNWFMG